MRQMLSLALGLACSLLTGGDARAEAQALINGGGGALNETQTAPVAAEVSGGLHDGNFDIEAQSYANLATGSMGLKVAATPYVPVLGGPTAHAESLLRDTLKLSGPGNALVPVTFTLQFDALLYFSSLQASQGGRLHITAYFGFGGVNEDMVEIERALSKDETGAVNTDTIMCWGHCSSFNQPLTTAGVIDATLQFTALLSQDVNLPFQAYLNGSAYFSGEAVGVIDALNTAQLSAAVPTGYTLTSESGAFLTSPVPEPAPWMLMLLAPGAWLLRRRTGH